MWARPKEVLGSYKFGLLGSCCLPAPPSWSRPIHPLDGDFAQSSRLPPEPAVLEPSPSGHRARIPPLSGGTILEPPPSTPLLDRFRAEIPSGLELIFPLLLLRNKDEAMSGVVAKFAVTSMVMWIVPVAIVYGFYYQMIPGVSQLSSSTQTLISGFLAVISVNLVIGFYICMAMKETPHQEPQPDPTFLANAKASINQPTSSQLNDDSKGKGKVE